MPYKFPHPERSVLSFAKDAQSKDARCFRIALTLGARRAYCRSAKRGHGMSKVEDALGKLEEAVARLERAARRGGDGHAAKRNDGAAIAVDAVAQRLDAMIGRIDRVLEG